MKNYVFVLTVIILFPITTSAKWLNNSSFSAKNQRNAIDSLIIDYMNPILGSYNILLFINNDSIGFYLESFERNELAASDSKTSDIEEIMYHSVRRRLNIPNDVCLYVFDKIDSLFISKNTPIYTKHSVVDSSCESEWATFIIKTYKKGCVNNDRLIIGNVYDSEDNHVCCWIDRYSLSFRGLIQILDYVIAMNAKKECKDIYNNVYGDMEKVVPESLMDVHDYTSIETCTMCSTDKIYTIVPEMPSFPNGYKAMKEYIRAKIESCHLPIGKVMVSFVVEKNGKLTHINVVNSTNPALNNNAIKIVNEMPLWNPGKINGENVRVKCYARLYFNE